MPSLLDKMTPEQGPASSALSSHYCVDVRNFVSRLLVKLDQATTPVLERQQELLKKAELPNGSMMTEVQASSP
jgi:hypothetical protein